MLNQVQLNAAKPGNSTDSVSAVTQKGKMLLGVKHDIVYCLTKKQVMTKGMLVL